MNDGYRTFDVVGVGCTVRVMRKFIHCRFRLPFVSTYTMSTDFPHRRLDAHYNHV